MVKNLKILGLLLTVAFAGSCGRLHELSEQDANGSQASHPAAAKSGVNVPRNMKNAVRYGDLYDEPAALVTLPNNSDILYRRDAPKLSTDELGKKLEDHFAATPPNAPKTLHLVADAGVDWGAIVKVLELARRKRLTEVKFVVAQSDRGEANEAFALSISELENFDNIPAKPDPNYLLASLQKDGTYKLNQEDQTLDRVRTVLPELFKDRATRGIFRKGTNEIEQTVRIKAPLSAKYEEVVRLIDAVKEGGANPIVVLIDDLER